MNITLYIANLRWRIVGNSLNFCLLVHVCSYYWGFLATFHAILLAGWTPNTFSEVREDLAHLKNELGYQKAVPFEEQYLGTAVLVLKEMCPRELSKR